MQLDKLTSENIINEDFIEKERKGFLAYAGAVITARALPLVEDGLKPIHRRLLYTLHNLNLTSDKETKKSAIPVGEVLKLSAHGDQASYQAMVRMAQWWKLRYPLCEGQGNMGNVIGSPAAAMRYTGMKLSPIGDMMLADIEKECVDFRPNYDETMEEPCSLPGKFPNLLCNNSKGISVGYSCNFASHNFSEVKSAIEYYIANRDTCTTADLMQFIQGPDFPTGGRIMNAEKLSEIYASGHGSVILEAHYHADVKDSKTTVITFTDIPYGIEINDGVLNKIRKLILDEESCAKWIVDYNVEKSNTRNFNIIITINHKLINVKDAVEYIYKNTCLRQTFTINQTVIVDGKPKLLNLKQLIEYWVNYRSNVIKRIAQRDYQKTNKKLTITIGLQKCMSNIDRVINIIRQSDNKAVAKSTLCKEFELNEEQVEAILDMKLSRLSRLDVQDLDKTEKELNMTLAAHKRLIDESGERDRVIINDLAYMKKMIGKDERLTEICFTVNSFAASGGTSNIATTQAEVKPTSRMNFFVYPDGLRAANDTNTPEKDLMYIAHAYSSEDIYGFTKDGYMGNILVGGHTWVGADVREKEDTKIVCITKNGYIKISAIEGNYGRMDKNAIPAIKLKDGDELVGAYFVSDQDRICILNSENSKVLVLAISDLPEAKRLTIGLKCGFNTVNSAAIITNKDPNERLIFMDSANRAKFVDPNTLSTDSRGGKGQTINDDVVRIMTYNLNQRKTLFITSARKVNEIKSDKLSTKSRTAGGAALANSIVYHIA